MLVMTPRRYAPMHVLEGLHRLLCCILPKRTLSVLVSVGMRRHLLNSDLARLCAHSVAVACSCAENPNDQVWPVLESCRAEDLHRRCQRHTHLSDAHSWRCSGKTAFSC